MRYELIASDMDGTLLGSDNKISNENIRAIKEAVCSGVKFVICSGRADTTLLEFYDEIGLSKKGNYIISLNGSEIVNVETKKVIKKITFDRDHALDIISKVKTLGVDVTPLIYYTSRQIYIERETTHSLRYCRNSKVKTDIGKFEHLVKDDIAKLLFLGTPEELHFVYKFLFDKLSPRVNMFASARSILEFNSLEGEKGTALSYLCDILGVGLDKTIGIGDNYNDMSLIQKAGLGVAVNNAPDDIKKMADYVTAGNNDEHAVAEVIEKFILTK